MVSWRSFILFIKHGRCNITTLLTIIVFFQIYLLVQNYHASQYLQDNYFRGQIDETTTKGPARNDFCEPKNHRLFPLCKDKFEYLSLAHHLKCFKNVHKVDGSKCSIMRYLREIEPFCLSYHRVKNHSKQFQKLTMRDDFEGLMKIMSINDFGWVRARAKRIWPDMLQSIEKIKKEGHFLKGARKNLLFFLGSMGYQPNVLKLAGHGGFVGELVQWTDLITTSYVLGHNITIAVNISDLKILFPSENSECASKLSSKYKEFDLIFTDLNGNLFLHHHLLANFGRIRCKLRILDSFGTEAEFNYGRYNEKIPGGRSFWGNTDLLLPQFFTYFPHSPDNTFLGFIAGRVEQNKVYKKKDIAVIYGKLDYYLPANTAYLEVIADHFEIHATMLERRSRAMPSFIINHGVMRESELKALLRKAKLFIGLGFPFEGPGPLDAIANGAVYLNPLYKHAKNKFNDVFFKFKPTLRKLTSQNPYMEDFIGKPFTYTVDVENISQVVSAVKEIKAMKHFKPFLPREFTSTGMLEKLHALIHHQDFCDPNAPRWPPLRNLEAFLAPLGVSCKATCRSKGRICEPSYFSDINNVETFRRVGIRCKTSVAKSKLHNPSYHPLDGTCYLQENFMYFSCVAENSDSHRICPCRNFIKGQTALCVGCL